MPRFLITTRTCAIVEADNAHEARLCGERSLKSTAPVGEDFTIQTLDHTVRSVVQLAEDD